MNYNKKSCWQIGNISEPYIFSLLYDENEESLYI